MSLYVQMGLLLSQSGEWNLHNFLLYGCRVGGTAGIYPTSHQLNALWPIPHTPDTGSLMQAEVNGWPELNLAIESNKDV